MVQQETDNGTVKIVLPRGYNRRVIHPLLSIFCPFKPIEFHSIISPHRTPSPHRERQEKLPPSAARSALHWAASTSLPKAAAEAPFLCRSSLCFEQSAPACLIFIRVHLRLSVVPTCYFFFMHKNKKPRSEKSERGFRILTSG